MSGALGLLVLIFLALFTLWWAIEEFDDDDQGPRPA